MAKKYHPDRHHSPHLRDVHGLLEELFVKITNAYQALSNKIERRRYDSSLRTESPRGEASSGSAPTTKEPEKKKAGRTPTEKTAEIRYREGKRYYNEMAYFDAIQCLREAVRLNPHKAAYRKLLANSLAKNPHWLKEAEEHLQKVIEMDQFDVESFVSLGEIYEKSGMGTRAIKMFQKALDFDPNNETAREKLHGKKKGAIEGIKTFFSKKDEKEQ
jgi:tetratricopeptide (TPR) repeat protein